MPHDPDELVTIDVIAARRGIPQNTIYGWRHKGWFPEPDQRYGARGGILMWRWRTVAGWNPPSRVVGRPQA